MDIGAAFGAAGAAQTLRDMLAERFKQQMDQQRMAIEQQKADQAGQYHTALLGDMADTRAANAQLLHEKQLQLETTLHAPTDSLPPDSAGTKMLTAAGLTKINPQPADAQFLDPGGQPDYVPGEQPGVSYLGTGKQRQAQAEQDQTTRARADVMNAPDTPSLLKGYLRLLPPGEKPDVRPFLEPKPTNEAAAGTLEDFLKRKYGDNPTPDQILQGRGAFEATGRAPKEPKDTSARDASRSDKSYQFNRAELDKIQQPLDQQNERIGKALDMIDQGTPSADAFVAPSLLTAVAGGAGSGLRMNEAEISRIVGGRSKWETLKATLQQWSADPSKANSITPEQRAQMRQLASAVQSKMQQKIKAITDAGEALYQTEDVTAHRQIVNGVRQKLQQIDSAPSAVAGPKPSADDLIKKYGGGQ